MVPTGSPAGKWCRCHRIWGLVDGGDCGPGNRGGGGGGGAGGAGGDAQTPLIWYDGGVGIQLPTTLEIQHGGRFLVLVDQISCRSLVVDGGGACHYGPTGTGGAGIRSRWWRIGPMDHIPGTTEQEMQDGGRRNTGDGGGGGGGTMETLDKPLEMVVLVSFSSHTQPDKYLKT